MWRPAGSALNSAEMVISCAAPARNSAARRHGQLGGAAANGAAGDAGVLAAGVVSAGAVSVVIAPPGGKINGHERADQASRLTSYELKPRAAARQHPKAPGHPLELLAVADGCVPGEWRSANGTGPFLGVDHTLIAVSGSASSAGFFGPVFGFSIGTRTEDRGPSKPISTTFEDVHVSVTRLAPDLPAPRLELVRYHVGTRLPIPHDTASGDIAAAHSVVRVASLGATAAAACRWPMMT